MYGHIALSSVEYFQVYLGVKTCEVFLSFQAVILLGSVVLTQWLLCIHWFTSLLIFTGFFIEYA